MSDSSSFSTRSGGFDDSTLVTLPSPLEPGASADRSRSGWRLKLSLFWRTFILLALLLVACVVAWLQTVRAFEYQPRAYQSAQETASLVNLARVALTHADAKGRVALIKAVAEQEQVRILQRDPKDTFTLATAETLDARIALELVRKLGEGTVVATQVNNNPGFWVGFTIGTDPFWLRLNPDRFTTIGGRTWMIWLATALALSLAGAALMTRFINLPLQQLSRAARQLKEGDYHANRLDEHARTSEIRAVNVGFNRMAEQLAKIDQDRAVMLAGISHDLRTPLARLRLETEMSVADPDAREHMAADISQLDLIIDKFLDYARPESVHFGPVLLGGVVEACSYAVRDHEDVRIKVDLPADIAVMADEVELQRVISNLIENARRYGRTASNGVAEINIQAQAYNDAVLIKVRDHGPGVDPAMLADLTKPFFRGDAARTSAVGAGLGLSIVAKSIERMGGSFALTSTPGRGFAAHMRLPRAAAPRARTFEQKEAPAQA